MKMYEAAQAVLKEAQQPLEVRTIYDRIVDGGLFKFGAKNPVSVLSQTLRERSPGGRKGDDPLFVRTDAGKYGLADWKR